MESLQELLVDILNIDFIQGILSNPRTKDGVLKIKVRPVEKKGSLYFQFESFTETQAFHENLTAEDAGRRIVEYMSAFRQMQMTTRSMNYTVLVSKRGKLRFRGRDRLRR